MNKICSNVNENFLKTEGFVFIEILPSLAWQLTLEIKLGLEKTGMTVVLQIIK